MSDSFIPDSDSFVPDEEPSSSVLQTAIPAMMGSSPFSLVAQLSNQIPATPENAMAVARPVLEQGGMMGGAAAGTAAAPGIGTVAGAGIGQGVGRVGADALQAYLNNQPQPNNVQMLQRFGTGAATGAGSELAGMGIAKGVSAIGEKFANPLMQKALGFSKRFRNTKEARQAAKEAADVALENNVMPWYGSPSGAAKNLEQVNETAGQGLGDMRSSVGPQRIDHVYDSLSQLQDQLTQGGAVGGTWDQAHAAINDAKSTLVGLQKVGNEFGEVDVNKIEAAKKDITDTINYLKKNATQSTSKKIAGAIENGVEKILAAHGADMEKYAALKKAYGGSANALKALNNELSLEGNSLMDIPSTVMGAAELPEGGAEKAGAIMTALGITKKYGAGISSNIAQGLGNQYPLLKNLFSLGLSKTEDSVNQK